MRFALRCRGRELPLRAGLVLLGRDPECDIRIDVDGVMDRHVAFRIAEAEVLLETTQGTVRVDGVEVPHSTRLRHGSIIQLGEERIRFVDYHEGHEGHTTSRETRSVTLESALDALADLDDALSEKRWTDARDQLSAIAFDLPPEISRNTMLDALGRSAAALAGGTGAPRWIDWFLELCRLHLHVPSSSVIDAVADAGPRCGWRGGPALDQYMLAMQDRDAREQLRVRRLVAIARRSNR